MPGVAGVEGARRGAGAVWLKLGRVFLHVPVCPLGPQPVRVQYSLQEGCGLSSLSP